MSTILIDINAIDAVVRGVADAMAATAGPNKGGKDGSRHILREAVLRFIEIARHLEASPDSVRALAGDDLTHLSSHALTLLEGLEETARDLDMRAESSKLVKVFPALAVWLARKGAQLDHLEPVANAFAALANGTREPTALVELSGLIGEVIEAAGPTVKADLEKGNPERPWRILNLNWAIVATRTHDVAVMERVFPLVVANIPEEMPTFFAEGMRQMESLDYPPDVRSLMARYHAQWSSHTVH